MVLITQVTLISIILWIPCSFSNLKYFSRFFDVCIIPFKMTEVTKSVSPVKMFEFMAMGKPIVTSALPECKLHRSCLIAENSQDFVLKIDQALSLAQNVNYQAVLKSEARANTWEERGLQTQNFLQTVIKQDSLDRPTTPLLSIVVPSYNMEAYLPVLMEKLKFPSLQSKIEVILVNDGSKDSTLRIARKYEKVRIYW